MSRKIIYHLVCVLISVNALGVDPQFSQFYANPLYLAPSFAGAVEGSRMTASYRSQWWEMQAPFHTYSFSYDHYFSTFNSGVGLYMLRDVAGSGYLGITQIALNYSYNIKVLNIWYVRPGISFTYLQYGLNKQLTYMDDILHPTGGSSYPNPIDKARDIDAGVSALVYSKRVWVGATMDHLLTPNVSLYSSEEDISIKTSVFGGYELSRRGKLLKPSEETMTFAFQYRNVKNVHQLDLGVYWFNYPIVLGLWYRGIPIVNSQRGDAIVFLAGIKTRNFNVGYSYDFTISSALPHTKGSHEITAAYKFLLPERAKKGAVPCPEF